MTGRVTLAAIVALAIGCADSGEPTQPAATVSTMKSSQWQLASMTMDGKAVKPSADITMRIDGERKQISGSAGCNRYSAGYSEAAGEMVIERAAATKRYCGKPEGVMDQESKFLQLLANRHAISDEKADQLVLKCAAGTLEFVGVPETDSETTADG